MKFGLKPQLLEQIKNVFAKYDAVAEAFIYGSRAIGTHKNGSDIDICLKGENLNLSILAKITNDLDDLLSPYKFDISIFNEIENKDLINHINSHGICLYQKN